MMPGTRSQSEMGRFGQPDPRGPSYDSALVAPAAASYPLPRIFIHHHKI